MKEIRISNKYSIFTGTDKSFISDKDELLKIIELNRQLCIHTNNNSVWMEANSLAFRNINEFIKEKVSIIDGRQFKNFAEHYWIYTQTKGFKLEWMHDHKLVHPPGRSHYLTDYTFTYYIQTPDDITGDEGHIVFQDENKKKHKFLPKAGDYFIFPADIPHTAIPTPNSDTDRIVYAGSLCIDIFNQKYYEKSSI